MGRPRADKRKAAGQKSGGRGKKKLAEKFSESLPDSTRSTAIAAKAVGMSRSTFERAKAVVESGDRKLIDEMNRTGINPSEDFPEGRAGEVNDGRGGDQSDDCGSERR